MFELEFESEAEDAPLSAIKLHGKKFEGPIVYTGPARRALPRAFRRLPYRSLDFVYETFDKEHVLPCGTVNFTVTEDYTRITEFKYLTGQKSDKTTIMKEYSRAYEDPNTQTPYYAILSDENRRALRALPRPHREASELLPAGTFGRVPLLQHGQDHQPRARAFRQAG